MFLIFNFFFINNYINILNYDKQFSSIFYKLQSIYKLGLFALNEINISPSKVRTYNGIAIEYIKEEMSSIL